ncbi:Diffuse panbronchiolitis critical region protein 1 [Pteropus alecto]|uniref:Diffuse panbronchiolitis critical region protein 1 n=1 Tax=Pteropus alecto TaxID=9402 RepID=L5KHM8_PTEAL|nr:Diffuse panbronchiolitis critical region protein 1 [Pteropus alecto]
MRGSQTPQRCLRNIHQQEEKITRAPSTPNEHEQLSTSAHERITNTPAMPTEHTSAEEKITRAPSTPNEHEQLSTSAHESITKTPAMPPEHTSAEEKITRAPSTPNEHEQLSTSAHESITKTPAMPTEHTSAEEKITRAPSTPNEHEQLSTSAHESITRSLSLQSTSVLSKMTRDSSKTTKYLSETIATTEETSKSSEKPIVYTKKITSTKRRTTPIKISIKPTENPTRNIETTETMKSLVKLTGDKSISTSFPNKTAVTHQVAVGSFTPTSSMELNSIMSEAPYQNKGGFQGGLPVGVAGENGSFPVWAIVIVVLVAVILFQMCLGLIFLVSYMARTRRTLFHNTEDNDPEDNVGPNSYPVYSMEQQTLGVGQTSSSQ